MAGSVCRADAWVVTRGGRRLSLPLLPLALLRLAHPAAVAARRPLVSLRLPQHCASLPSPTSRSSTRRAGAKWMTKVPATSEWAAKYSCGAQPTPREIVDTKAGYVYDSTRLNQLRPGWGLLPAAGKAQVYLYPDCKDGRVVADVVRLDKGHTEGLEPKVTEELVKLMLSAKGGKIQQSH